ncbi:DsbA family protein [Agrococcus baldri]|uniref:Thioredoxin-like fold domain-containing protein n=1 Tax=Agrococcus baldri TaxID=153730 RepID=A0AA87RJE4_9MICO|nr:thioredoxin domain-containing protein [Agrococcus baldri]GEK81296.1 hypothetical protein ABA31_26470 [Agrococcus baldri]
MRRLASLALIAAAAVALTGCLMPPPAPVAVSPDAGQGTDAPGAAVGPVWPANMASHGVIFTAEGVQQTPAAAPQRAQVEVAAPHAILYVDFLCPHCGTFEAAYGDELGAAVEAGEVALEIRPLTFMDRSSPDEYSTRAANAFAAVADEFPGSAWAFHRALFAQQPAAGEPGLTDDELIELAAGAGASSERLAERIRSVALREFTVAASESGLTQPVAEGVEPPRGTPALYLDGVAYQGPLDQPGSVGDFIASQG